QPLDVADEIVADVAHGAADEARERLVLERERRHQLPQDLERVPPADRDDLGLAALLHDHVLGEDLDVAEVVEPDERVAAEVFPQLDGLEEDRRAVALELEEGGARRLEVRRDLAHGRLQLQLDRRHLFTSVRANKKTRPGWGRVLANLFREGSLRPASAGIPVP